MIIDALDKASEVFEKAGAAIDKHQENKFKSFRRKMSKKSLAPFSLFCKYELTESAKYRFVITDKDGNVKYISSESAYHLSYFLYDSNSNSLGKIWLKTHFLRANEKLFKVDGVGSGKITKKIELVNDVFNISKNHNVVTISNSDGLTIARIVRNGFSRYLIEYTDPKYELLSIIVCMSDNVYDGRPRLEG